jgi:hypothetical protein
MTEHNAPNQNQPAEIINPASQGAVNAMISAAVKESVSAIFASLAPTLKSMALTPETLGAALREANRPYDTPEKIAAKLREERESLKSKQDEEELRRQTKERQDNCAHTDRNGHVALGTIHNFPDHMARGICPLCHALIEPACWKIGTALTHPERRDFAYIQPEHPKYYMVRQLESMAAWILAAGLGLLTFGHALVSLLS